MVTKQAGGKITGLLALTMEAQVALSVGDFVHIVGDYEVALADGTKPVLGHASVSNRYGRESTAFTTATAQAVVPGSCTVEARGFYVKTTFADGAIAAGAAVVINATGGVRQYAPGATPPDTPDQIFAIALTGAAAAGEQIDILVR